MTLIARISHESSEARLTLTATRKALRLRLERNPRVAVPVGQARRAFRLVTFHVRARLADVRSGDPYLATGRVFRVATAALQRRTGLPYGYDPSRCPAAVVPGDWDQPTTTILETPYWSEFRAALTGERSWESTAAYRSVMRPAETETSEWRRRLMVADGRRVIRGYESLYESMRSTGCLSQAELAKRRGAGYRPTNTDDISIAIGRDGELLLCQGGHRVETARALGIEAVPVWVGVRHPGWWALRRRILAHAEAQDGRVPEPLLHPDLDNIPFRYDCGARFEMIRSALPSDSGRIIDLSPGWGYFLHRLEEIGFDCAGISSNAEDRYFLERLRAAGARRFTVMDESTLSQSAGQGRALALLLLRGLDAWLGDNGARERLTDVLMRTRPMHVFLESPAGPGDRALDAVAPPSEAFLACTTAMSSPRVKVLGRIAERYLYRITDGEEGPETQASAL